MGIDYEYHTSDECFSFVKCEGCGLVYLNPAPTNEEMSAIYPSVYKPFHFGEEKKSLILSARNVLETRKARTYLPLLLKDARIIDVGCGDGRYLGLLKRVNASWRLEGIDFSEAAVARARSRGINGVIGDYETTELPSESYDLMILNQVLEHFLEPAVAMEKIRRELRPGGLASFETPSLDGWDRMLFSKSYWGGYHFPRHMTLFTERTITAFARKHGFEVVSIRYLYSPVFWVFSLHHAFEHRSPWVARFFSDRNPLALAVATVIDIFQLLVHRKTSNMQVVVRKVN